MAVAILAANPDWPWRLPLPRRGASENLLPGGGSDVLPLARGGGGGDVLPLPGDKILPLAVLNTETSLWPEAVVHHIIFLIIHNTS